METDNPVPLPREESGFEEHKWDGSESEFVEDEDIAEYEEHHTGIKLSYKLKDKELYSCLTHTRPYKIKKTQLICQVGMLFVLAALFFLQYFFYHVAWYLFVGLISLVFAMSFIYVFSYRVKKMIKYLATGKTADVEIYPDSIVIKENKQEWEIKLDGTCIFEEHDNMMLIYLKDGKVFIVPIRCIEPDLVADIQAMIIAGTKPKKED